MAIKNENFNSSLALKLLAFAARLSIGVSFLLSARVHFQNPWQFLIVNLKYDILPNSSVAFFAAFVPPALFVLGTWLIAGAWLRVVAALSTVLVLGFLIAQVLALLRGLEIGCGCFGGDEQIGIKSIARTLVLAFGCVFVFLLPLKSARRNSNGRWRNIQFQLQIQSLDCMLLTCWKQQLR